MEDWEEIPHTHGYADNMRGLGVADLACAVQTGRACRCSGETAYHVLDVMHALGESSESGRHIDVQSTCIQPAPLPQHLREGTIDA
jgi:hypothetical protein